MDKLFVGVARESITPPLGTILFGYPQKRLATEVHDGLNVTAFAFKSGEERLIMISADICVLEEDECDIIANEISAATGIPADRITFSATHTHSGPTPKDLVGWDEKNVDYIVNILRPKSKKAALNAISNMKEALMGVGTTNSLVGINRRERSLDGKILLGQNPWGVFNTEMTVLHFKSTDGESIGTMVNYGAHGTAAGDSTLITRDWPGAMCDAIEEKTGAIAAFFPGPTGDTGPRVSNGKTTGNINDVESLGKQAGEDALKALSGITDFITPEIKFLVGEIKLPYKPLMPLEEAKAALAALGDTQKLNGVSKNKAYKYSRVIEEYESGRPMKESFSYKTVLISIGDIVFMTFPFEVFTEIPLRIARVSPFKKTLALNNTGGSLIYFPTKSEIVLGGYEVVMFEHFGIYSFGDDSDSYAVKGYLELLGKLNDMKSN